MPTTSAAARPVSAAIAAFHSSSSPPAAQMKHGTASASTERAPPPAAVRVTPSVRGSRLSGCGSNAGGRSAAPTAPAPPKCGGEPERSFRSAGGSPLGPAPPLSERRRWPGPGLAPRARSGSASRRSAARARPCTRRAAPTASRTAGSTSFTSEPFCADSSAFRCATSSFRTVVTSDVVSGGSCSDLTKLSSSWYCSGSVLEGQRKTLGHRAPTLLRRRHSPCGCCLMRASRWPSSRSSGAARAARRRRRAPHLRAPAKSSFATHFRLRRERELEPFERGVARVPAVNVASRSSSEREQ